MTMNPLIEQRRAALEDLCRAHRVRQLELFGSAASESFDPARSDLDFLVVFEDSSPVEHAERYLGLLAGLQDLFECDVDLVEVRAIRNPHFRRAIEFTRKVLVGSPSGGCES